MADCQEFAALFDNTCDTTTAPDTLDDVSSKARFCTNIGGCDDALECSEPYLTLITKGRKNTEGYTHDATWHRKLCVTCFANDDDNGDTYIRV